jgi:hypothetical protein
VNTGDTGTTKIRRGTCEAEESISNIHDRRVKRDRDRKKTETETEPNREQEERQNQNRTEKEADRTFTVDGATEIEVDSITV